MGDDRSTDDTHSDFNLTGTVMQYRTYLSARNPFLPRRLLGWAIIGALFIGCLMVENVSYAQDSTGAANDAASLNPAAPESSDSALENAPAASPKKGLNFLSLLFRGGWFMIPLAALSIFVVTISIERWLALRKDKLFPPRLVTQLAKISQIEGGLDPRSAYQVCQQYPSSASYVLRSVLSRVGRPQAEIESCLNECSQREATRLNGPGSWLTLAAAIAPLIGLLGTVWGITQAFYDTTQLMEGQNRSEALAQGIYTALVTTLCGLMIAIPAAVMAHFFENRIIGTMNQIQEMVGSLLPQFERYEGKLRFSKESLGQANTEPKEVAEHVPAFAQSGSSSADNGLPTVRPK